ncbi:gamma-glutamyltransferase [Rhodobacteraceae bacterium 2CG4]|uniref:Gamma-glutamyltransferase n=1 Tax=Halovulum marinum TaxID=2662447 RepID=A0A6L5YWV1_9RHOB|nr:gamma-glutamyltransferase [Halovulum marinum]MSU88134.1 gamma-glutamyltransferase [Halovulum marinum]
MTYAVATGHALTTEAAEQILRAGGSAVDACIAAACTAFVAEPVLAQPLGGGFLMLAPGAGAPHVLDAFVQTPRRRRPEGELDLATITVDFGTATQDFHIGAGTVATPTLIPALFEAHDRHGRMPWADLVAHAAQHARAGVTVTAFQAEVAGLVAPILTADADVSALCAPGGKPAAEGTVQCNPQLADVLEVLAAEGPRFFTEGEVGQGLTALPGSHLTGEDLRHARHAWRPALTLRRQGHDIALNPPPSLGGVQIALALSALPRAPRPVLVARALAEVARLRADLDIDRQPDRAGALLLDPDRVAHLRRLLASHTPALRGTTHISVIAADGSGAALSLSNGEGCGRLIPGTGIQPNNMLGEEDLSPDGPVGWVPDRRLASMMCPTAMRGDDGTLTLLGSGGSNRIRSALATTLLALVDAGLPPDAAVAAPRMHVENGNLSFEGLGADGRREALLAEWPQATVWDRPAMYFGGVHIARRDRRGGVQAAGDPRRAGAAASG